MSSSFSKLLDACRQRCRDWIHSKHMLWGVALVSLLESIIIPIPLEAMLIPLMQAKRERLWAIAAMATLGCLIGASVGYWVGFWLFDWLQPTLVNWLDDPKQLDLAKQQIQAQGFWFVLSVGITPVPFQIAMLAAGATGFSWFLYLLATVIARSLRYFGLALLVYSVGNRAQTFFYRYGRSTMLLIALAVLTAWLLFLVFN